ncbi:fimbrial protein [Burkholderia sp. Se-20378]|uniref:fimbrial protein n=1 Tax=Burkholderia sp. Se-20378 TaxID=2703899 RepID=UPI00198194DD|nr:fimbrial protein [Burkholderia sp. Se-20378]MBN3769076.1 type 1 fimbrial protein [Burkholderia sp. Se-20378]
MKKIFYFRSRTCLFGDIFILVSLVIFFIAPAYSENCTFQPNQATKALTFTAPTNLHVPRDASVGTVVWESPRQTVSNPGNDYSCAANHIWGLINAVGEIASAGSASYLPIGKTGLAWSILYRYQNNITLRDISLGGIENFAGKWQFGNTAFTLRIIKIGSVAAGASISAGLLGYVSINKEINAFTINVSNQSSVGALSCKTPDVVVKMGDQNRVGQFKGSGTSLVPVNFSIGLRECPEGISKISYLLKANTKIVDTAKSVVSLDADSTAKGVGIQILDDGGNPAPLNKNVAFNNYDSAGGNFNIPLRAAYHQTSSAVEPGTANSSLNFVMSYN